MKGREGEAGDGGMVEERKVDKKHGSLKMKSKCGRLQGVLGCMVCYTPPQSSTGGGQMAGLKANATHT